MRTGGRIVATIPGTIVPRLFYLLLGPVPGARVAWQVPLTATIIMPLLVPTGS